MRRLLLTIFTAGSIAVSAACSSHPEWHPVTTDESQNLAITRFNNFDRGTRPFHTSITVSGKALTVNGWIDFTTGLGYAGVSGEGFEPQTLMWDPTYVALTPTELDDAGFPSPTTPTISPDDSIIRDLNSGSSNLDTLLVYLLALGIDRPENPLLLQQAGALWIGKDAVDIDGDTVEVSVYSAPQNEEALTAEDPQPTPEDATVKLSLDSANTLVRSESLIAGEWVTITFPPSDAPAPGGALPNITEILEKQGQ